MELVKARQQTQISLPEGRVLTVTCDANSSGVAYKLDETKSSLVSTLRTPLLPNQTTNIGPFSGEAKFLVQGSLGTLSVDTSHATTVPLLVSPLQATTALAPPYQKGAMYFDTTLNKMRIGGASAWETVTSV
jgi:hypothetical protein